MFGASYLKGNVLIQARVMSAIRLRERGMMGPESGNPPSSKLRYLITICTVADSTRVW